MTDKTKAAVAEAIAKRMLHIAGFTMDEENWDIVATDAIAAMQTQPSEEEVLEAYRAFRAQDDTNSPERVWQACNAWRNQREG